MHEFALHEGHRYTTVMIEAERERSLQKGHRQSHDTPCPFSWLLVARCARNDAVAMNSNTVHCGRFDQANPPRQVKLARTVVEGAQWLLLSNRIHLEEAKRVGTQSTESGPPALQGFEPVGTLHAFTPTGLP